MAKSPGRHKDTRFSPISPLTDFTTLKGRDKLHAPVPPGPRRRRDVTLTVGNERSYDRRKQECFVSWDDPRRRAGRMRGSRMTFDGLEHIVRQDEPLGRYSWFRLGGNAEYFAEPTTVEELAELARRCRAAVVPLRLLGGGSNLLVAQPVVRGLVVHLSAPAFTALNVEGDCLHAGAGAKLGLAIATAVREGLGGLESLVGIPGTVGGALCRNAAVAGNDIGQWADEVTVMTRQGNVEVRRRHELQFGYGRSSLDEMAILSARFRLEPGDPQELTRRLQKHWILKRAAEPSGELGAGRVFADPQGMTARELIEQVGLRNAEQGGARVSDRDANFIVATAEATADDVLRLIERIREQVASRLGVDLQLQLDVW